MMDTTKEKPAAKPAPLQEIVAGLAGEAKDRGQHRKAASTLAAAGRPWEQLPVTFRRAVRADATQILGKQGAGADALVTAGYSARLADQLLRDIGRR